MFCNASEFLNRHDIKCFLELLRLYKTCDRLARHSIVLCALQGTVLKQELYYHLSSLVLSDRVSLHMSTQVIILWRREKLKVSFDYLEDGWFSSGDELQQCRQRLIHMIDARLQSADMLPFIVQLPQEFIDEHAKVCFAVRH